MILCTELICILMRRGSWTDFKAVQTYPQRSKVGLSGRQLFSYKELLQLQDIVTISATRSSQILTRRLCKYWRNRSRWYRNSQWLIIWKHWWRGRWRQREVYAYRTLWRKKQTITSSSSATETKILKDSLHPHQTL